METTLRYFLERLRAITDSQLLAELAENGMSIPEAKFHIAFSCFGITRLVENLPLSVIASGARSIPESELEGIRKTAATVFHGYTTLVFMRSEHLEARLDAVRAQTGLDVYRQIFRSGCPKKGQDTFAQHLRNSFSHGSFSFSDDVRTIKFTDRNWKCAVNVEEFREFCRHVYRFYKCAYEARSTDGSRS